MRNTRKKTTTLNFEYLAYFAVIVFMLFRSSFACFAFSAVIPIGSLGVDAGETEFEDAHDFAPAVQAPAEKAQHPEIGTLPKSGHAAAALGERGGVSAPESDDFTVLSRTLSFAA